MLIHIDSMIPKIYIPGFRSFYHGHSSSLSAEPGPLIQEQRAPGAAAPGLGRGGFGAAGPGNQ